MAIVTLTTDLGRRDFYLASVKAKLLEASDQMQIVDISNEVELFDIVQAAFLLSCTYSDFPKGTIHLLGVDTSVTNRRHLIIQKNGHYFIGPDNGIFSLMFQGAYDSVHEMVVEGDDETMLTFPLKSLYVKLAAYIATGGNISDICEATSTITEKMSIQPIKRDNMIQGSVLYIDNYGNVIINVTRDLFTEVGNGFPFQIHYRRKEFIDYICTDYAEVPEGEVLALFGDSGYLQIAINKDRAADLLGLNLGAPIQIEFI